MKSNNWRVNTVFVLVFLFGAAVLCRLFYLQVLNHKLYQSQALGQQTGISVITGDRGQIFCQNSQETKGNQSSGEIKNLAINKDNWTIFANPNVIADKSAFAEKLSQEIGLTKEEVLSKIEVDSSYVLVKENLAEDELEKIKSLELAGLSWDNITDRFYSQGELASQVIGFLGGEGNGQYGIEGYFDDILKGKEGVKEEKSGLDSLFSSNKNVSLDGSDIYLTIDYNIQFKAESLLKSAKEKVDIDSGQIIVMNPNTGKILALANYPAYNPNQYSKVQNMEVFQETTTQKLFEPGSIMKPFTMAAALNEGKITKDSTYVDTGIVAFKEDTIHNFANEKYGKQTMTGVLENSINTGAVFAEQQVSHETFWSYLQKFGFFEPTDVQLQGEVYSANTALKNGHDIEYATASFGQGIEMTPMQIARGFCAIANGGKMVKPYIVEKIVNGGDEQYTKPEISQPILTQQTVSQLKTMLISVVDNGFNSVAKIPGYYLAGKTGTAQIPLTNGRGYEPDNKTIQSFVGFGPALNPQFVIMVKLDKPKVSKSALSAVPVFKDLAQYIINYWKIPPDYDVSTQKTSQ